MDLRSLILNKLQKNGEIRTADIAAATGITRTYIKRVLQNLKGEGKILLIGKANQARYVLPNKIHSSATDVSITTRRLLKNSGLNEDLVLRDMEQSSAILVGISKNIRQLVEYTFSEMLNNAIEHSQSKKINVVMIRNKEVVRFDIIDHGIGIFNNIRNKRKLHSTLEAIQDLLKGKQTTAPKQHSGEGIFFTSKAADILTIQGSDKKIVFDNLAGDFFIHNIKPIKGTKVVFSINLQSKRNMQQIFKNYSSATYGFTKTSVDVKLYEMGNEYISRSQARRIMFGLEKFKNITLDFKNVQTVGQGFADEVFRIWKNKYPSIHIGVKNANDNVLFMIKRAQS